MRAAALADPSRTVATLRHRLDELAAELQARTAERDEALAQQAAMAEVLQVINALPGDLAPVFDAMLEKAARLCEAQTGHLFRFEDGAFVRLASHGVPERFNKRLPLDTLLPLVPNSLPAQMMATRSVVHVHDLREDESYRLGAPHEVGAVEAGIRTVLFVPLLKEGEVVGHFTMHRMEVKPFSEKQIALLQSFAAQAVIAIENARLLDELRARTRDLEEALEYQTATSDVLKIISRSTFDLQGVLETLAQSAATLTRSDTVFVFRREGEVVRLVAQHAPTPAFGAAIGRITLGPDRKSTTGRALLTGEVVRILDVQQEPDYQLRESELDRIGSTMAAPLLRDGETIGVITLARLRVEPYTDRQVELVRTFADQAVIAIENARLLTELRERTRDLEESLEYQTATSDVLKVISRSTFDLQPVLSMLTETAVRLCGADAGHIALPEGEDFRTAAVTAMSPEMEGMVRAQSYRPGRSTAVGRALGERRVVQIADIGADTEHAGRQAAAAGYIRTILAVPLLREGEPVGAFGLARSRVEPFTERQIELVRTFADQAVIAIENTRLLTELREALEQQQAMAELLEVINASPGELQPVFEVILEKAHSLCGATRGTLFLSDGQTTRAAAVHGYPAALAERLRQPVDMTPSGLAGPLLAGARLVHNPDLRQIDHPRARDVAERGGVRTNLLLPLRKDGKLIGYISCNREEVRPFTDKEIGLLESFAAQAVIAIDNARLLDEIRRRQAELRVTFDNMGDGVAMFDAELRLAAWNRNFQQMLDLPDAVLAARPRFAEYFRYLAERGEYGSADLEAELRRAIEDTGAELRFERMRPDGRVVEVRRNAVPGGGFVLMYGDVTERKRAEEQIRAARDAAEKALAELRATQQQLVVQQKMAALGQLTAGIAHEIKNPLNFVNNFAGLSVELLDELKETAAPALGALDDDTRAEIDETIAMLTGNLDKIAEHGRRADGIVKSMLAHSRGGSGDWQTIDLNALVEETLNLAYHGARAQDQNFNIAMERDFAAGMAPVELVPQDLTRVFLNLIGNGFYAAHKRAREAGDGFRPVLAVTTRDLGDAVEIRIRDNGAGIAPEHRDRLFQPFFTTKPTGEGTGLGLSISHDIVTTQHGGTITVDSQVGEFTEFTVRLPRR
ncbi:MAG TPA: GAF domain-containing protein [Stellaceae bacterium]|nr:GAF domain-containing protein [Stellaceae bacterium]